jgi:hypothetical protein
MGTLSGVYACQDPAAPSWRRVGIGLPFVKVTDLRYQPPTDILTAGTYGSGVFSAAIGDISPPTLHVSIPRDECGIGPIEGQTVVVHSTIQPTNILTAYSYTWTVNGAQLAPGENGKGPTFKIIAPSPSQQVQLALAVSDDDGFIGIASATFAPLTFQMAPWLSFLCRLKYLVKVNWFVDPLWDPFRDLNVHPVTEADFERVLGIAEQTVANARFVALRESQHRGEVGRLPSHVEMNDRLGDTEGELGPE